MLVLSRIDYHSIMEQAPILYLIGFDRAGGGVAGGGHAAWGKKMDSYAWVTFSRCRNLSN